MGQTTPNMSIYVPADGETNYGQAFLVGMNNVDSHDHSGAPNKGLPITSSGLGDFSVQYRHLNINVADTATGIQAGGGALANQLRLIGMVSNLYTLGGTADLGLICKTNASGAVAARTLTGTTNQIAVSNDQGILGNPTVALTPTVLNTTQPSFQATKSGNQALLVATTPIGFSLSAGRKEFTQGAGWSNPTFTAPVAGVYSFSMGVGYNNFVAACEVTTLLSINGGAILYQMNKFKVPDSASVGGALFVSGNIVIKLAATDTVQVVAEVLTNPVNAYAESYFSGALLY